MPRMLDLLDILELIAVAGRGRLDHRRAAELVSAFAGGALVLDSGAVG